METVDVKLASSFTPVHISRPEPEDEKTIEAQELFDSAMGHAGLAIRLAAALDVGQTQNPADLEAISTALGMAKLQVDKARVIVDVRKEDERDEL